ncbi:hypothetical protein [Moorena sp. SIO3I6]|uniref:hypothetical protein n=1 Tax=Moorena sp. SIO3I6 TaxID=2607831 RepID=UPI0013F9FC00|nr:hypothetical protein [Moorena sp. SIO3I6]NEP27675.1 hypothetical protein [Moorena sp. SIO3I6]
MPNRRNAVQTDIETLISIYQNLSKLEKYLRKSHVDQTVIDDIESAKNSVNHALDILHNYSDAIANIYQAPPPRSETF